LINDNAGTAQNGNRGGCVTDNVIRIREHIRTRRVRGAECG
jgi:hypothetical protein